MSRAIEDLKPWFQPKVRAFLGRCQNEGQAVRLVRTLTTDDIQAALFAIGRSELTAAQAVLLRNEGLYPDDLTRVRTRAQTAQDTAHGVGLAFDLVPLLEGKPWDHAPSKIWQALYHIAEGCGLDAMGDGWGEFLASDKGHFQEPGWRIYRPIPQAA